MPKTRWLEVSKVSKSWSWYQHHQVWWDRLEWTSATFQKSMGIVMLLSWLTIFQNVWKRNRPRTNQLRLSLNFCTRWINNQGRKFVNEVCKQLHKLMGVEQRVMSAYHPQPDGLIERQKRIIKNSLVKVLEDNPEIWPLRGSFLLIALVDILLKTKLHSCWCITASQFCQFMWHITCTKMKTKDNKTDKEMEIKNIHSISTFLMPSFNQRRKTEQQSPMMKPTISNLLRKKKYEIMILDVCLKQKLRWIICIIKK